MPDLAKLAASLGMPRIPPLTALRTGDGFATVIRLEPGHLHDLEMLTWNEQSAAWRRSATTGGVSGAFALSGHPAGVHGRQHPGHLVVDVVTPSEAGTVSHRWFDEATGLGLGEPWRDITSPEDPRFKISAPMTVTAVSSRLLVAGLSIASSVLALVAERKVGSYDVVATTSVSGAVTNHEPVFTNIDSWLRFDCPPVLFDHADTPVLVGVDRDGWIRFGQWSAAFGWSSLEPVERSLDRNAPPAVASDGPALHVLGLDPQTGELRETVRSQGPDELFQWTPLRTIATPLPVTWGVSIQPVGAITAASDGAGTLLAMALDSNGQPLATVRLPSLDWLPLFYVPTLTTFAARGGLAIASPAPGVFIAAACDRSGAIHAARWTLAGWTPFLPV